jgi:hypothetical protein
MLEKITDAFSSMTIALIILLVFQESLWKAAIIYIFIEYVIFFIENYLYGFFQSKYLYQGRNLLNRYCFGLLMFFCYIFWINKS